MVDLGKYKQKSQPKISFWANQLKCVTAKHFRHNYLSACENKLLCILSFAFLLNSSFHFMFALNIQFLNQ